LSRKSVIMQFIRPIRGRLIFAMFLTTAYTLFSLLPPLLMRYLLDHVITPQRWMLVPLMVATITLVPIWSALLAAVNRVFIASLGQRLVANLRTSLYRHVLGLSMGFHGRMGSGPVVNRLMGDISIVQQMVTGETLGIVASTVQLAFATGIVFTFNWILGIPMLLMLVLYTANYRKYALRIRGANLDYREIMDTVAGQLQERLAGVRLVKTYCRERDETSTFLATTDRALQHAMHSTMLSVTLGSVARIISGYGSVIIWSGCAWFVLDPEMSMSLLGRHMTYGDMQAVNTYVNTAIGPAVGLTMVADSLVRSMASLDRIIEILQQQPDLQESPDAGDLPDHPDGELRMERVFFSYEPDKPLFQGLNLHIPAGKMTALVGHTGCGKTTVTSLLMRLWDVQGGKITIDGVDLRDIKIRSLRKHVGVVPQEPVVFEATVFDNIAYAMPNATLEEVEEAARAAQIHDHIVTLPDGYRTWLGKDGSKLSVGQKQRVAIARAIVGKPAVLILDEATSSLDSESEAALQEALRVVLHGRTSVVVAHRLSTIVEADQIVSMDDGKIIEVGTHDELMYLENGYYRKLYEELKGRSEGEVLS